MTTHARCRSFSQRLRSLYRAKVYNRRHLPITFRPHPHSAFGIVSRITFVALGSVVPLTPVLRTIFSSPSFGDPWAVAAASGPFVILWAAIFWPIVQAEEKSLWKYLYLASVAPANATAFYLLLTPAR